MRSKIKKEEEKRSLEIEKVRYANLQKEEQDRFRKFLCYSVRDYEAVRRIYKGGRECINVYEIIQKDVEFNFLWYMKMVTEEIFWDLFDIYFKHKLIEVENAGLYFLNNNIFTLLPSGYYDFIKYLGIEENINDHVTNMSIAMAEHNMFKNLKQRIKDMDLETLNNKSKKNNINDREENNSEQQE